MRTKYLDHRPKDRMTRLRYHCLGKGPLYKIAFAANMHPSYLSRYCNGLTPITNTHLAALSRVLRVNPADLLGWIEVPKAFTDLEEEA